MSQEELKTLREQNQLLSEFVDMIPGYVASIETSLDRNQLASATRICENLKNRAHAILGKETEIGL